MRLFRGGCLAIVACSAFGCVGLGSAAAQGSSVKALFVKYDLLGTLAADCTKPADAKSPYVVNRAIDADHVQLDKMVGPSSRQFAAVIDKASESKPNEIALSYTIDDKRFNVSVQVERGRMRFESAQYSRCLRKVALHNAPEGGGKCVEPLNGEIKAGVRLQTWDCNDTPPQIFAFDALNERLTVGDLCVGTEGGHTNQGVYLALMPCDGAPSQSFKVEPNGNNVKVLGVGGFCVDVEGAYKGSGAAVHLWQCGTTSAQVWQLAPALDLTLEESSWHDGHTIADFVLPGADAKYCQTSCIYNRACTAWSYRKPEGRTDHQPHCWLLDKTAQIKRGESLTISGGVRPEAK